MMSYEPVGKDKTISNFKCRITRSLGILQIALGLLAFSVNTVLVVRNFASNKSSKDDFPLCSLSGFWTGFFFSVTGVTALLVDTRCRVKALAVMAPFTLLVSVYLIVWSSLGIKHGKFVQLHGILVATGAAGVLVTIPMICSCMKYLRVNKEAPLQVSSGDTLIKDDRETAEDLEA